MCPSISLTSSGPPQPKVHSTCAMYLPSHHQLRAIKRDWEIKFWKTSLIITENPINFSYSRHTPAAALKFCLLWKWFSCSLGSMSKIKQCQLFSLSWDLLLSGELEAWLLIHILTRCNSWNLCFLLFYLSLYVLVWGKIIISGEPKLNSCSVVCRLWNDDVDNVDVIFSFPKWKVILNGDIIMLTLSAASWEKKVIVSPAYREINREATWLVEIFLCDYQ